MTEPESDKARGRFGRSGAETKGRKNMRRSTEQHPGGETERTVSNIGTEAAIEALYREEGADNRKLVAQLCRGLAEQGDAGAQFDMGMCCAFGRGVEQDLKQAAAWFRKAAEQGHAPAQHNLGVLYECGEGVEEDAAQAVKWYRAAAEQGDEDAKRKAIELAGER